MALQGLCGRDPADWFVGWHRGRRDLQSLGAERLHLASVVDSLPPTSSWSRCSMAAVSVSAEDAQDPPSCLVKSPPATKSSAIPSRIHTMPANTLYSRWPATPTQMPWLCPLCPSDSLFFFCPFDVTNRPDETHRFVLKTHLPLRIPVLPRFPEAWLLNDFP